MGERRNVKRFSDEAKQKLLQYVKDVTSTTTWDTITDFWRYWINGTGMVWKT